MYGTRGRSRLHCACPAFSAPAATSGRCEAWIARYPYTYADSRLARALIFSAASELGVRHSSATIPLRVSLFLFEMPSAAARTSFSYRNLARTRAAGSASSGGSTTHVMTYFRNTSVRATWAWASVWSPCTCFAKFVSVAATRASNCSVASVLAPCRISCSQAAMRNACSERKPRSLTAARTWSLNSAEGYRKLREKPFFSTKHPFQERYRGGTTLCSKWYQAKRKKCKQLSRESATEWPQPFMFQYPSLSPMIRLHCMHPAPIGVDRCLLVSSCVDSWSLVWIPVDSRLLRSILGDNCRLREFSCFTSARHGAICTAV